MCVCVSECVYAPVCFFSHSATGLSAIFKDTGQYNCYNTAAIPSTVLISLCNQQRIFFLALFALDLLCVRSCEVLLVGMIIFGHS